MGLSQLLLLYANCFLPAQLLMWVAKQHPAGACVKPSEVIRGAHVLQWSAETNASITAIFFRWLVGPLETKEVDVEFEGEKRIWRSGVQIKKCRYLEQSGCVGMCINMCKVPFDHDCFTVSPPCLCCIM